VCFRCLPKISNCPVCNGRFQNEQNIALENISRQLHYPCRHRRFGCSELLTWDIIQEHEEECCYGIYGCPICEDEDIRCPWKGPLFDLKEHLITNHENKFSEVTDTLTQTMTNMRQGVFYDTAIYTMGELFYRRVENTPSGFYGYVQYIGPQKNSKKYKFELSLQKSYGPERLTACFLSSSCRLEKRDIYMRKNCLQIKSNAMEYFVNEDGALKIVTKISRVE
jgi:E3 ubiquitin-protein ligase SIAH1